MTPQLTAWLRVIREGESGQTDEAYTLLNGGGHFGSFADHPYAGQSAPPGLASGAYQFIPHTWQDVSSRLIGPGDFSPQRQDAGAAALVLDRGAGPAIEAGDLAEAIRILAPTWVSLPSLGLARAQAVFQRYGGTLMSATQPAAPIEEREIQPAPIPAQPAPVPAPTQPQGAPMGSGLLLGLAQSLIGMFAPALQQKLGGILGTGAPAAGTVPDVSSALTSLVSLIINTAQGASGKTDPIAAVAAVQASPAMLQTVQETMEQHLNALLPVIDKLATIEQQGWTAEESSKAAAAVRNTQIEQEGTFMNPAFIVAMVILSLVAFVVFSVLWKDAIMYAFGAKDGMGFSTDMMAFVIGAVVGAALTAVVSYFLGSTRNSAVKDATLATMANAKTTQK